MPTNKNRSFFREIEHTADVGLELSGESREDLFVTAALGFRYILYGRILPAANKKGTFELTAENLEELFVLWLSELNYQNTVNRLIFSDDIKISFTQESEMLCLTADLNWADSVPYLDQLKTEIKAVTYHQLFVQKHSDHYTARVIFDI